MPTDTGWAKHDASSTTFILKYFYSTSASTTSTSSWNMSYTKSTWNASTPVKLKKKKEIEVTVLDFHTFLKHKQEFEDCMACTVVEKWRTFENLKKNTKQGPQDPSDMIEQKWGGNKVDSIIVDDPYEKLNEDIQKNVKKYWESNIKVEKLKQKDKFVAQPGEKIVTHAVINQLVAQDIKVEGINVQEPTLKMCDTSYPNIECKCGAIEIEWKIDTDKEKWEVIESKIPKWE